MTDGLRSEAIGQLAAALAKAQGQIKDAERDSHNPHFQATYADLSSVWAACRDHLSEHELAVIQTTEPDGEGMALRTTLAHSSGEWIAGVYRLHPMRQRKRDEGGWEDSSDPQSSGSALTYARRYALAAMVGVAPAGDDDDAEGAMRRSPVEIAAVEAEERLAKAPCPECGAVGSIRKGAPQFGGGWFCWKKRNGCGQTWETDPRIPRVDPETGEIRDVQPTPQGIPRPDLAKPPVVQDPDATPFGADESNRGFYLSAIKRISKKLDLTVEERTALRDKYAGQDGKIEEAPIAKVHDLYLWLGDTEGVRQWRKERAR